MEGVVKAMFGVVFIALVTMQVALATQRVVGGSQGWDVSTDLKSWAAGQKFKVGDQLVFKYTNGLHSVVELGSESAYKSCDISSATNSLNSGSDVVKLNKAGTRYFACGTMGHCSQGMKLKVTTLASDGSSSPADSSSSSPTDSSSSSSPASTSDATICTVFGVLATTFFLGISLFLIM